MKTLVYKNMLIRLIFLIHAFFYFNPTLFAQTVVDEQKQMIKELTGVIKITNRYELKSRSKRAERSLSRQYLSKRLLDIGITPHKQSYTQPNIHPLIDLLFDPFQGANVYGIIPATKPSKEYVVIGAHFDTEFGCPGAIDNGSGVALVYSVARQMLQVEDRGKHLMIVFFDQEEEELNGSRAFVDFLKEEKMTVHSVHTVDAIGWDKDGDRAVEVEYPTETLKKKYEEIGQKLSVPTLITGVNGSDHAAFRAAGFNVTGLTSELVNGDYTPYKDTPEDTYETVNFDYLASSTNLVFEVIKSICQED